LVTIRLNKFLINTSFLKCVPHLPLQPRGTLYFCATKICFNCSINAPLPLALML